MDRATAEREDLHMDTKMPNETSALVRDLTGIMKQESDEHPHSSQGEQQTVGSHCPRPTVVVDDRKSSIL